MGDATVHERIERARGCGFRQGGGIYLVCAGVPRGCGKLPVPLTTCPTCSAGIKPSRGWTWVNADPLLERKECAAKGDYCSICPFDKPIGRAGLLWIGERFYPFPSDWLAEANTMGVSRRLSQVPKDLEIGKTWVLVAHRLAIPGEPCVHCAETGEVADGDKLVKCVKCKGRKRAYTPGIFHAFRPTALEYVVKGDETTEDLERLEKRGLSLIKVIRADDDRGETEQKEGVDGDK